MQKRIVAVGDSGKRVGEDHGRARLTNHEVDLIRQLRATGLSYRQLALKFDVSKWTVRDIVKGRKRGIIATAWKTVTV